MKEGQQYKIKLMLDGCRRNHRLSQLDLYRHYYSYALSICLRYAKSRNEAEEILNDGFFKVFKKINQYDPSQRFEPWLRRILINTSIDYYRKYNKKQPEEDLEFHEEWNASVDNEAIQSLAFEDAIGYLQHLSPAYRMVFNLFVVEAMSHKDIAKKLGISEGTSKSNLAKARAKLRSLMISDKTFHLK